MLSKGIKAPKGAVINLNGKRINVHVGRNPTAAFTLYASLIRDPPKLFDKALHPDADAIDSTIRLPDITAAVFQTYAHWLYHGVLPNRGAQGGGDDPAGAGTEYAHLAGAYILGEELGHGTFCDAVLDAIIGLANTKGESGNYAFPGRSIVRYVYANTAAGSPIRRFLVDIYVANGTGEWLPEELEGAPPGEFLLQLARGLFERDKCADPRSVELCVYHLHKAGEGNCYRSSKREEKKGAEEVEKDSGSVGKPEE